MLRVFSFLLLGFVGLGLLITASGWQAFGKQPTGERLDRVKASENWSNGVFVNSIPLYNPFFESPERWLESSDYAVPQEPLKVSKTQTAIYKEDSPLRITWFGHSISLIEMGEVKFLTDPVWSKRVSPFTWAGPDRWYEPPLALDELPEIDAVLISHDHYDHLDYATIQALSDRVEYFVVPLGVGEHLEYWGVDVNKIVELDWWQTISISGVEITSTPARHASGRFLTDFDKTLWMGFALKNDSHSVYFSGDTGLFPELKDIGERLGPFDITMIEVGAYGQDWPDWHIGPEQAVLAHNWVRGDVLLPVHWGMYNLARHSWVEPIERTIAEAERLGYEVYTPEPGVPLDIARGDISTSRWWPDIEWQTGEQAPIVATGDFSREPLPR